MTPSLTYSTIGGTWWYTLTPHFVTCTGSIPFNCVHFWVGSCTELLYHSLSFSPALLFKHSLQQLPHMCSYMQRPIGWMTVHASCVHRIGPLFVHTIPIGMVLCTSCPYRIVHLCMHCVPIGPYSWSFVCKSSVPLDWSFVLAYTVHRVPIPLYTCMWQRYIYLNMPTYSYALTT